MEHEKLKAYFEALVGKTLTDLNTVCEMFCFMFEDICINSQCFTRILHKEQVLLTTTDYQSWDGVTDKNNDQWYNLSLYKDLIVNTKCSKAELTDTNDAFILTENDIRIQIFISNGAPHYGEDTEQWRIFEKGKPDVPHIVVYANFIQAE